MLKKMRTVIVFILGFAAAVIYSSASFAGAATQTAHIIARDAIPPDTQVPTTPTNLQAAVIFSSQINLTWTASTDDMGVAGYKIYRDGSLLSTINYPLSTYSDMGLQPNTTYSYTISAYDAAGNESARSQAVSTTTLALPNNPPSLEPIANITAREGEVITIIPQAADIDGDVLTYLIRGLPERADYDFNPQPGRPNWRTAYDGAAEYDLNFVTVQLPEVTASLRGTTAPKQSHELLRFLRSPAMTARRRLPRAELLQNFTVDDGRN